MTIPRADALVFFGATGDLAYKKIFPALQAMVRRGAARRAGHRRRQVRLERSSSCARARATASRRHGGARRAAFAKLASRLRYVDGDYRDPTTFAALRQGARGRRAPGALPRDSAEHVRGRRRGPGAVAVRARRARGRREAVRPRPRVGAGAERDAAPRLRRARDLPHRSLPRQGAGAEPPALPLRQHVPRADLEPQLRRERADHDGRELRRRGARPVLRGGRRDPRRRPEPPAAGGRLPRDGGAGDELPRVDPRRAGEGLPRDPAAQPGRPRARPVPRLPRRGGRRARLDGRDVRRGAAPRRLLALGRRAVLHPRRQVPADDGDRGDGDAEAPAAAAGSRAGKPNYCASG